MLLIVSMEPGWPRQLAASLFSTPYSLLTTPGPHPHRSQEFVFRVTPEEWFEGVRAEREAKKAGMKEAWLTACAAVAQRKQDAAAAKQRAEHDMQWARTQQQFERAERAYREALGALREAAALQVGRCCCCQGLWVWGTAATPISKFPLHAG